MKVSRRMKNSKQILRIWPQIEEPILTVRSGGWSKAPGLKVWYWTHINSISNLYQIDIKPKTTSYQTSCVVVFSSLKLVGTFVISWASREYPWIHIYKCSLKHPHFIQINRFWKYVLDILQKRTFRELVWNSSVLCAVCSAVPCQSDIKATSA